MEEGLKLQTFFSPRGISKSKLALISFHVDYEINAAIDEVTESAKRPRLVGRGAIVGVELI